MIAPNEKLMAAVNFAQQLDLAELVLGPVEGKVIPILGNMVSTAQLTDMAQQYRACRSG